MFLKNIRKMVVKKDETKNWVEIRSARQHISLPVYQHVSNSANLQISMSFRQHISKSFIFKVSFKLWPIKTSVTKYPVALVLRTKCLFLKIG